MKKLSVLVLALSVFCGVSGYSITPAVAAENQVVHSQNEAESIKVSMEEIEAAAKSGDEQLVAKLLASAIKSYPKLADKIVAEFVESQSGTQISSNQSTSSSSVKAIDVYAVMNSVIASLQNQQGSESLIAAVLSSYNPASGGNNRNDDRDSNQQEVRKSESDLLPPSLPRAGQIGRDDSDDRYLPQENKNQTSAH